MSGDISSPCVRCGRLKWLLLERRPGLISIAGVVLGAGVVLNVMLVGRARAVVLYLAVVLVAMMLGSLVRIRCVRCEPLWKAKAWRLVGRDLDGERAVGADRRPRRSPRASCREKERD